MRGDSSVRPCCFPEDFIVAWVVLVIAGMFETVMALTTMVNIGKGGLALGYAAETDRIEL